MPRTSDEQAALQQLMGRTGEAPANVPAAPPPPSRPINAPGQDSIGPDYQVYRKDLEQRAALQSLMQNQPAEKTDAQGNVEQPAHPVTDEVTQSLPYRAAKDLVIGATETPRAIGKHSVMAVQNMVDKADDFGQWVADKTGLPAGGRLAGPLREFLDKDRLREPETVTGKLVGGVTQFLTGLALTRSAMGGTLSGMVGGNAQNMIAAAAAFDPHQQRLSNLIEQYPQLSNPVTRFLQAKPGDSEAEGMAKTALESVLPAKMVEGTLKGIGMLRAMAEAKEIPETPAEQAPLPTPKAAAFLGDANAPPEAPLVSMQQYKASAAERATEGITPEQASEEPAEKTVNINFARIDTPADVQKTWQQLAELQKDNIDVAKRGIQTFKQTQLGADFTDAWDTLMKRRIGQPLNAEEQLAGRHLLAQSAMKADESIRVASETPTPENLLAFRKMMQVHAMIQAEVTGSQAEIARALGAMRIKIPGDDVVDRMASVTGQLDAMGGNKTNLEFLQAAQRLVQAGKLEDFGNVAARTAYARTRDALLTGWTNGLLTLPTTHVKVNLSNMATIGLRLLETRVAEGIDKATGYDGVPTGEAAQRSAALMGGIKDSFRYVGKLLAGGGETPETVDNPVSSAIKAFKTGQYSVGKQGFTDWSPTGAQHSLDIANSGWLGNAVDMMSSVVTSPGRSLAGEHEFYRAIGMRMGLQAYAYRQAMEELASGSITREQLAGRVAGLVENPPPHITTAAISDMEYQTFTGAVGNIASKLEQIRNEYPLTRVVLPFYKIPSNIFKFEMERTPLAPLYKQFRDDITAGGPRQSMAIAKMGIGTMSMLAASDYVLSGRMTGFGPKDKAQRQAMMDKGWQPYSVQLPTGRWVQYNRLEPTGALMGMAADMTETARDYFSAVNADDADVERLTGAGALAFANNITSKTYFQGVARFVDAISDPRSNSESWMKSMAGSAVPGVVGAVDRLQDPYVRATYSMMDAIKSRIPGYSETLPPLQNRWGEPISHESGLGKAYDLFVPFASHKPGDEPIDNEIIKQGFHFGMPSAKPTIMGERVDLTKDPQSYARYVELAGNGLKLPMGGEPMGLKDTLNAIVTGQHPYSDAYNRLDPGPDGGQAHMLRDIIERYQKGAQMQLLKEQPELQAKIEDKRNARMEARMQARAQ